MPAKISLKENSGAKLWEQAKKIIPGGNQLLSKRAEMFLPELWPAYYKKSLGCEIWDLDDNHYYDMSIMGIGTSPLGYAHPKVTNAVIDAVSDGCMSSLNCFEEVQLAEKLIDIHPWAGGVRFSRTGGEACSMAVRIARAHTGKDKIAFCGYHGWHDWYLATNLKNGKNLDNQLLPGLSPSGVPKGLGGTVLPFNAGDITALKTILEENKGECAAVMMEIFRHEEPDVAFIKQIKTLCEANGMVLIFDEVSSGFRLNTGAAHLLWDFEPDICVLGKALGNGHPISAVIGRRDIMDAAQLSFISSSYWTERVGFVAALKTLEVFESENIPKKLIDTGDYIRKGLLQVADETGFNLEILGVNSVLILLLKGSDPLVIKTLFTQEMLKRGFLASNVIYVCAAHSKNIVDLYLKNVEDVFTLILEAEKDGITESLLEGPVCHSGFSRLN